LSDLTEKTSHNIQTAIASTAKNASALQRVAKKSVDHLTHEILELISQGSTPNQFNEAKDETINPKKQTLQQKSFDQNSNNVE